MIKKLPFSGAFFYAFYSKDSPLTQSFALLSKNHPASDKSTETVKITDKPVTIFPQPTEASIIPRLPQNVLTELIKDDADPVSLSCWINSNPVEKGRIPLAISVNGAKIKKNTHSEKEPNTNKAAPHSSDMIKQLSANRFAETFPEIFK